MMIRHNIVFKVKPGISDEVVSQALNGFRAHERNLRKVLSIVVGQCRFHDEKSTNYFMHTIARGATHCISIDFVDREAVNDFFNDPNLLTAKEAIVAIAEGGYDGIVAFDLENPHM